jgi:3-oxoacid CoA-transferase subunit B/3-oxoadipate CoA-transferase beta subunit
MDHCEKSGASKLLHRCSLPLTGAGVVDLLITELGVFEINRGKTAVKLIEVAPGVTVDEVKAKTEADFEVGV